jgi:hypothetical protein
VLLQGAGCGRKVEEAVERVVSDSVKALGALSLLMLSFIEI